MTPPGLYRPITRADDLRDIARATWPSLVPAFALLTLCFAALYA